MRKVKEPYRAGYDDAKYRKARVRLIQSAWGTPCPLCPKVMDARHAPTIDHIRPLSQGGANHPGNWRVVGRGCNSGKRGRKG